MKAVVCADWGPAESLSIQELPSPPLGAGQVRVKVHACGVNFADTLMIQGKYQVRPERPFSPGIEIAGEIAEVAEGVAHLKPGMRVMGLANHGGFAEEVVTHAGTVLPMPPGMDFTTAAGFPVVYGTSHLALAHRGRLKVGETLLVFGAAGGVGLAAVEIGKKMGARVIACASTPEKLEVAKAHGADELIDYSKEDVVARVKALGGADVVYDPVGGSAFEAALKVTKFEGRILIIGFAGGTIPQIPANILLVKNIEAIGVLWGNYTQLAPKILQGSLTQLLGWYAEGALKPHVSETFPLERAADALNALSGRKSTGKVVVTVR
ncbi:MAG TPA: NADPH:quinone oxidoreductase family protein [Azospirillaceae bacterium]|nr:NADPH:quinone oxidoreductase family protein [Azospirillaceae bacterium]